MVIYCSGGQICSITGSWSPGLSFKTLKSKFECITNFIFQFWGFLAKLRENINLQEIYLGEVSLPHSENFLSKNYLFEFSRVLYLLTPVQHT